MADGSHTFQVKATDAAGNTSAAASYTWTIDTAAPTATITASPTNPSNSASPSFSFSSEAGATFTCALDGAAFAGCSSPKSYASVADGSHTFQVKATDAAGNIGVAASFTWTIDTAAPTASITASPTNPSNNASPSFSFSSESGATLACSLDGAAFASCSSPKSYTSVADGSHTFQVKATDAAGNSRRGGQLHLDGRHGRADGEHHCVADEPEQQRQPELLLQLGGGSDVHLRAGRRRLRRL